MAGLYIHIPFCHSKCYYCDFYSTPDSRMAREVVEAMAREWTARRHEVREPIGTIYLGGGTPSILDTALLHSLFEVIPTDKAEEFTIEVNPEDVTVQKCREWKALGINRVSMGVQSFIDSELSDIGRRHTSAEAIRAYNTLRDAGFHNISLDLIYGLPGQDLESWKRSVDQLIELTPEHFSAYSLSYEPGTRLTARLSTGRIKETDEVVVEQMYNYLCDSARAAGYEHYEISNFAKPGHRSIHNSNYWNFTPYIGLGPGAHSFDGHVRRFNPSNNRLYLERMTAQTSSESTKDIDERGLSYLSSESTKDETVMSDASKLPIAYEIDEETERDRLNDQIFVALRTSDGLDLTRLPATVRADIISKATRLNQNSAQKNQDSPILTLTHTRLAIPESAFLISDLLISDLLLD